MTARVLPSNPDAQGVGLEARFSLINQTIAERPKDMI